MCAAQKRNKVSRKLSSTLPAKTKSDILTLQTLVKNLQELNGWQNHVLEELARQTGKLTDACTKHS